jgi:hypothetical protein
MDTSKCAGCMNPASMVGTLTQIETFTDQKRGNEPVPSKIFVCGYCKDNVFTAKKVQE